MKVNFEVDATPEEWRRFFGMPDMTEVHESLIKEIQSKIATGDYDPVKLMSQFMPENMQAFTQMQQGMWENMFKQSKK